MCCTLVYSKDVSAQVERQMVTYRDRFRYFVVLYDSVLTIYFLVSHLVSEIYISR